MSDLAKLEGEKKEAQDSLNTILAQLRDDPENAVLKDLEQELTSFVDMINESIEEIKPAKSAEPTPTARKPSPPPSEPEKWSRDNHPAFKKASESAVPEEKEDPLVRYNVGDSVQAKWVSGDRAFYPAKIMSITGSSASPIYTVKFKSYDNTDNLRAKDIRPNSNKRKADAHAAPATPAVPSAPTPGLVSSAGATIYPNAKREAEKNAEDPPAKKPKKIKAKKELEAGKNKWQEFNAKSKSGKSGKKDSMFRTPEGVNGRVGFTGSGQAMRKDQGRSRHVYQMNDDLD